jgi:hypothetical protein
MVEDGNVAMATGNGGGCGNCGGSQGKGGG